MKESFEFLAGLFFALMPILLAGLIGLLIYDAYPNFLGIAIASVLIIIGIRFGVAIFKKVQMIGALEFITATNATPDFDNLEPLPGSDTKKRNAADMVELITRNENLCKGGSIRIYGDWHGRPYQYLHIIKTASYDPDSLTLAIEFQEGERLEIFNPIGIHEAKTFFKVIKADRVKLTMYHPKNLQTDNNFHYIDYRKVGNSIETDTDVYWYKPNFDVSLGAPALMIFGKFE